MRVRLLALTALTAGLGLLGPAVAAADPMPGMDMPGMSPGMSMPGMTESASPPTKSLSSAIDRSRQKPVFLQAELTGANEVPVAGKPAVGDPDGSATGLVEIQGDKVTFAFSWKKITAPTLAHIHAGHRAFAHDDDRAAGGTPGVGEVAHLDAGDVGDRAGAGTSESGRELGSCHETIIQEPAGRQDLSYT